ncbi:PAS domain-containing protein [Leptolyngbya sp. KIOST-1]|uniref:PAS domain-containing protein n=1 Tax=Leptolyngbya sp. KIOST-1 TaxID=1229172 RepID=UPI000569B82A|nr:PAS domain-containing protein [Leptolyngbya sp. KIOST-1]
MKILFLEADGWEGSEFKHAIAALTALDHFESRPVPGAPLPAAALAAYDIVFLPLQAGETLGVTAWRPRDRPIPYWVVLTNGQVPDGPGPWMPQSPWDYFSSDHLSPPQLTLVLQRILNAAQREKRLQALEWENQWLKTALDSVPCSGLSQPRPEDCGLTQPTTHPIAKQVSFQASLLHQVKNGVVATDLDGNIVHWNRYAEVMYQWTAAETIGKNIVEVLVPGEDQTQAQAILQTVEERGYWEGEFEVYRKDGHLLPIYVVNSLLRDPQGTAVAPTVRFNLIDSFAMAAPALATLRKLVAIARQGQAPNDQ